MHLTDRLSTFDESIAITPCMKPEIKESGPHGDFFLFVTCDQLLCETGISNSEPNKLFWIYV